MKSTQPTITIILRIVAGVLALVSFVLVGLRLYGYSDQDIAMGSDSVMHSMRLLFPLSLGLLFGYLAWKGKFPFSSPQHPTKPDSK